MKNIVFPFNIDQDNKAAYTRAMNKAKETGAKLIFFTALKDLSPITKDMVYLHLLDLYGYYQSFHNNWQAKPKVVSERIIKSGDFKPLFQNFLESTSIDWVVPTEVIKNGCIV